ncbi:hypothetical protein PAAG_02980 [Paracoccidioides lutzii Pb01]|uniref:Acyl-CoA dehydrogenase n=1 Tax=Paracoccidioides lutzii (strain ATCC MYA-826 / Pb01) TaxID=502779 RepID=C1GY26_PARBA|nr:hypothetical protein PAAG_02980 [Paracoccidioides lutzii Pb01]EEH41417.2 hypothetical protein PAAG_02980 [Paracoccidioides lutzii Pb01]
MATNSVNPIPFSEPPYLCGLPSPYYTEAHRTFQKACHVFMWENLTSHAFEWEREGTVPEHVWYTFAKHNMLVPNLPSPLPVVWLKKLGINDILGVKVEDWDLIYTGIYLDEMRRSGLTGPSSSLSAGMAYGIPPILKFGSPELQERFLPDLLTCKKRSVLPSRSLTLEATLPTSQRRPRKALMGNTISSTVPRNGMHGLVKSTRSITNGIWADYTTMAVRTGGPGPSGLSIMVVPLKNYPGVTMRRLSVTGQACSGTTFIELDDVKVPVENLIGQEGMGMKYIMTNFNHERLTITIAVTRQARVALSAVFEYCLKREAFGKTLMDQPVVRHRLAKAGAELEAMWAWVEQFLYQLNNMSKEQADFRLGGLTALAKAKAGMVLNECAQVAVLLFGGSGLTRTGQGEIAERIYREVPGARIPGGSEDVLLDLSVRQLVKVFKTQAQQRSKI